MKRIRNCILLSIIFVSMIIYSFTMKVYAEDAANRLWGNDRYGTAVEISKAGWTGTSEYAVLVTGDNFPDALCASPLAKLLDAPILLASKSKVDSKVLDELKRLEVKKVFIVGGTGVISASIEDVIEHSGMKSERLYGDDRYLTSLAVADRIANIKGYVDEVAIATGDNYPDALSIAPVAAKNGMPIILTEKSALPEDVRTYLRVKGVAKTYIIGGTGVITEDVENQLPSPKRLEGDDRFATNIAVMEYFFNDIDFSNTYMTTGNNYPDALAGSVLAAKSSSPIILLDKVPGKTTQDFVAENRLLMKQMIIIGGEGVVAYSSVEPLLPKIVSIDNISVNVNEGDSYSLPVSVRANMDNATVKDVPVAWNAQNVDTNSGMVKTFTGTVKGYGGKVNLTLNIMHPIMGKSKISAEQMAKYLLSVEPDPKINCTALELARLFIEEGEIEGVRGDIAFCQSFKETNYFRFTGDAKPEWNNYCGLGVTTTGVSEGNIFATPREGVRAQIQHLKAYASLEPLVQECVDVRFKYVFRGRVPYFEWLGKAENPENANRAPDDRQGWAPGDDYGHTIISNFYEKLKAFK